MAEQHCERVSIHWAELALRLPQRQSGTLFVMMMTDLRPIESAMPILPQVPTLSVTMAIQSYFQIRFQTRSILRRHIPAPETV